MSISSCSEKKNIDEDYSEDKKIIYLKNIKPENADMKTFEVLGDFYTKDKTSVYFKYKKIEDADSKTFKSYETNKEINGTIKIYDSEDKNSYYLYGEVVMGKS